MIDQRRLANVARRGAERGGRVVADRFRTSVDADFADDDVTTATDRAAEDAIRAEIRDAHPDHAITGEERGHTPGDRVEWLIDPIDGTNNYAMGDTTFAVAISARTTAGEPLAAAIHEPLVGETLLAATDHGGVRLTEPAGDWSSGDRLAPSHDRPLSQSTVSFVVGINVVRDDDRWERARDVRTRLTDRCKRTLTTWAPCVDWGLLVRGGTAGIVCVDPDDREQLPGELLAREVGLSCAWHGDWFLAAHDDQTRAQLAGFVPD